MVGPADTDRRGGLQEDFEDFFNDSLFGLATAGPDLKLLRVNPALARWLKYEPVDLEGLSFSNLLTMGGRIYFETHLAPLLRMQGYFKEIALELKGRDGKKLPVFVNAKERRDGETPLFVRLAVFLAEDRQTYERNLRHQKVEAEGQTSRAQESLSNEQRITGVREQFIAVLGHDLRNPLAAIQGGATVLAHMPLEKRAQQIVNVISKSAGRMSELINDVMDFARGRLGSGISLNRQLVNLHPVLLHVVDELQTAWPSRSIQTEFALDMPVDCDPARLSQLLSNLIANALTHGSEIGPVGVKAVSDAEGFTMSVHNTGKPISPDALERLFEPFTREDLRPSQQGLGLGLFIAAEIARAHRATLTAHSDESETAFIYRMARGS